MIIIKRHGTHHHDHSDLSCGGANEYAAELSALKITALFVILVTATLAALFPIAATRLPKIRISPLLFFIIKHFGTGVIIATAFVHIMPGAFSSLSNECLGSFWTESYTAAPGAIMMASVFFIFFVQYFATRYLDSVESRLSHTGIYSGSSIQESLTKPDHLVVEAINPAAIAAAGYVTQNKDIDGSILKAQILGLSILEAGIVFHSIFIGMTIMVTGKDEFTPLFVAIIFHQIFEGLGLGTRIAALGLPRYSPKPYLMAIAYGISTPVGCAIGFAMRRSYDPASETSLIVQGVFDSISSGLLLYAATVELLSHDFFHDELRVANLKSALAAILSLLMGASLMGLIGAWA